MSVAQRADQRWEVPSDSQPDKKYVVSIRNGEWQCSCPVWIFRRQECKHIKRMKNGEYDQKKLMIKGTPKYVLAKVLKPTYDEEKNELLIPLIPFCPEEREKYYARLHMEATIIFEMLEHGYTMQGIRILRVHTPKEWTARTVRAYIEEHGKCVYPDDYYDRGMGQ